MTGFVYFLRCGDFVKIGYSANPKRRLRYLQTATPFDFELLGVHPGAKWQEKQLHKIFASSRHRHEWFRADQTILEIAMSGLPSMDAPPQRPPAPPRRDFPPSKLAEYLLANSIRAHAFAGQIGVLPSTVHRWLYGIRRPSCAGLFKIERFTKGQVTVHDFPPANISSIGRTTQAEPQPEAAE
jgi:DNA-binding transcriptional regulator YdaS (Cro superfamily)